jgi:uroporphyrinogen-III synthase
MMRQVVVTRPRDEAKQLAEELAGLGLEPLVAPMLLVEALNPVIPRLERYGALAFTSANAVRAFAPRSAERVIPAYAVGEQTAAALRGAGFRDVRRAAGDAEALAALIAAAADRRPILHVSGRAVARDLSRLLEPAGITVDRIELYDARPIPELPANLVAALYACTVDTVLFFSARTAGIFGTLLNDAGLTKMACSITAICLSAQVAHTASALPWSTVKIAERPRTRDMIALLSSPTTQQRSGNPSDG